jgi:ubiquinone biosynthesis protein UbiJ
MGLNSLLRKDEDNGRNTGKLAGSFIRVMIEESAELAIVVRETCVGAIKVPDRMAELKRLCT